jgi:lipopolysaccharide export system permease protein
MVLIQRYLLRQLLIPTLLALAALSIVAFLSQSLSALDLIVDQRQGWLVFLKVTMLAMPELVSLIMPVAVFVAAVVALNRLHTEQELVVCFAGGMSRWDVVSPAMRLAAGAAMASLILNLWIAPPASQALRREVTRARADFAASMVRPGEFTEPSPGLTVFAQNEGPEGELKNLFVHQQRGAASTTFNALTGQITRKNGAPILIMHNGSSQEMSAQGVLNFLSFDEYALDLSPFVAKEDEVRLKTSDRYLHELMFPDPQEPFERPYKRKMVSEAHGRVATPLYCIAFMAVALVAVIGGPFSRLGYSARIAWASGIAAAVRILGFAIQALSIQIVWLNTLQYVLPLAVAWAALGMLFAVPVQSKAPRRPRPAYAGARA